MSRLRRRLVLVLLLGLALPWATALAAATHEFLEHAPGQEPFARLPALTHGHHHDADTPDHDHECLTGNRVLPPGLAAIPAALSSAVHAGGSPSPIPFLDPRHRPLDLPARPFPGDLLRI